MDGEEVAVTVEDGPTVDDLDFISTSNTVQEGQYVELEDVVGGGAAPPPRMSAPGKLLSMQRVKWLFEEVDDGDEDVQGSLMYVLPAGPASLTR